MTYGEVNMASKKTPWIHNSKDLYTLENKCHGIITNVFNSNYHVIITNTIENDYATCSLGSGTPVLSLIFLLLFSHSELAIIDK